jgi:hypothetical protein
MREALHRLFAGRPWWINALMLFCAVMTFLYLPWDIFVKPVEIDEEVWFGILFRGWAAKGGALLHWAVYAAGTWGFWKMRAWMFPWAPVYVAQIAVGMLVWSLLDERSAGWWWGGIASVLFAALAVVLWRARALFSSRGGAAAQ